MSGTFTPPSTGLYLLEIENTRDTVSSTDLRNYIDNILVVPTNPTLSADGQTFGTFFGSTRQFDLTAGPAFANKDYWVWMGYSATFPGIKLSGVHIPLNYDLLVGLGLASPGFFHPDFVGKLDASGNAAITVQWKPDASLLGLTLHYTYVVLSPGGGLPVLMASNHINATVTQFY